jgi:hypothetical protein
MYITLLSIFEASVAIGLTGNDIPLEVLRQTCLALFEALSWGRRYRLCNSRTGTITKLAALTALWDGSGFTFADAMRLSDNIGRLRYIPPHRTRNLNFGAF